MLLTAVRHGRTAWNADGRFQGQSDVPLDETGRAQAQALARRLAGEAFEALVCSDLSRASDTAEILAAGRPQPLERDRRWREMRFGVWEGLAWPEITARFPDMAGRAATVPKLYAPEGGETFDDVCARVAAALAELRARELGSALVVTHAGPLHALLRVALGGAEADALGVRFSPAGLTRLHFTPARTELIALNETPAEEVA